jgi:anti-anti-sigma factor
MAIQISRRDETDGTAVVTLAPDPSGRTFEVDLLASEDVETALKAAVQEGKSRIVVDLAAVGYMHSRAFWAIVRAAEECNRRGGGLVVARCSPYIARLVELTSAAEAVHARADVETGLKLLRGEVVDRQPAQ